MVKSFVSSIGPKSGSTFGTNPMPIIHECIVLAEKRNPLFRTRHLCSDASVNRNLTLHERHRPDPGQDLPDLGAGRHGNGCVKPRPPVPRHDPASAHPPGAGAGSRHRRRAGAGDGRQGGGAHPDPVGDDRADADDGRGVRLAPERFRPHDLGADRRAAAPGRPGARDPPRATRARTSPSSTNGSP